MGRTIVGGGGSARRRDGARSLSRAANGFQASSCAVAALDSRLLKATIKASVRTDIGVTFSDGF